MRVLGFGALNMDLIFSVPRTLRDGEVVVAGRRMCPGGSSANTIYWLSRLGVYTGFLGAVGDDEEGRKIVENLKKAGVDTRGIKVKKGRRTGKALSFSDRRGNRAIYLLPGPNLTRKDIDLDYVRSFDMMHLSSLCGRGHEAQREALMEFGGIVSLAPGEIYVKRGLRFLEDFLRRARIVFMNRKEMRHLFGDLEEGVSRCLGLGVEVLVITLGEEGCVIYTRKGKERVSLKERIKPVDTTGAGDAFAAGFLKGFIEGAPLKESALLGLELAKKVVSAMGAQEI